MNELSNLEGLLEKATKGPWTDKTITVRGDSFQLAFLCAAEPDSPHDIEARANATLIVEAVNALPSLIARLKAAEEALREIAEMGKGRFRQQLNWADAQDAIEMARSALKESGS